MPDEGDPTGGILSLLVWNLMFDELLNSFDDRQVEAKGFANDVALVISRPSLNTLVQIGQEAMNKALTFGRCNGLIFGEQKTEAVIFTWKRLKVDTPETQNGWARNGLLQ